MCAQGLRALGRNGSDIRQSDAPARRRQNARRLRSVGRMAGDFRPCRANGLCARRPSERTCGGFGRDCRAWRPEIAPRAASGALHPRRFRAAATTRPTPLLRGLRPLPSREWISGAGSRGISDSLAPRAKPQRGESAGAKLRRNAAIHFRRAAASPANPRLT